MMESIVPIFKIEPKTNPSSPVLHIFYLFLDQGPDSRFRFQQVQQKTGNQRKDPLADHD